MTAALTVEEILDLTTPAMLDRRAWFELLMAAKEARLVWPDPWKHGSEGWEEFVPRVTVTATAEVPGGWSRETPRPSRNVNRSDYQGHLDKHLSGAGTRTMRDVLQEHSKYGDDNGENVYPSNTRVAEQLGLARATVNRQVGAAIAEGWLRPVGKRGQAVNYRLCVPVSTPDL